MKFRAKYKYNWKDREEHFKILERNRIFSQRLEDAMFSSELYGDIQRGPSRHHKFEGLSAIISSHP